MFVWYTDLAESLPRLLNCLVELTVLMAEKNQMVPRWLEKDLFPMRCNAAHYGKKAVQDWPGKILQDTRKYALWVAMATIPGGDLADAVQTDGCWSPAEDFAFEWAMVAAQLGSRMGELLSLVIAARRQPKAYGPLLGEAFQTWRNQAPLWPDQPKNVQMQKLFTLELGLQAVARQDDLSLARSVRRFIQSNQMEIPWALFPLQCALERVLGKAGLSQDALRVRKVVLQSMQPIQKSEDKRALERFLPLLRPLPLASWPEDLAWVKVLRAEFPWMSTVIDALERQQIMAQRLGAEALSLRPILLLGPAGTGKTRFLSRLGELMQVPTVFIPLSGANDNMMLKGSARGWSSARPGMLVEKMMDMRCPNPLVILDELDKVSLGKHNGRVWETLLTLLEPISSCKVMDEYLLGEVDYSHISWVATANSLEDLPGPLRSRWEIVQVGLLKAEDFEGILWNLRQDVARDFGRAVTDLPKLDPEVIQRLRKTFARNPRSMRKMRGLLYHLLEIQAMADRSAGASSTEGVSSSQ